jgi:hypothetical protein
MTFQEAEFLDSAVWVPTAVEIFAYGVDRASPMMKNPEGDIVGAVTACSHQVRRVVGRDLEQTLAPAPCAPCNGHRLPM